MPAANSRSDPTNFEIAPGYSNLAWKNFSLDPTISNHADWENAIKVVKIRFEDRFLEPADRLIQLGKSDGGGMQRFGFAILAIDFLVIESLQGFREGIPNHKKRVRA